MPKQKKGQEAPILDEPTSTPSTKRSSAKASAAQSKSSKTSKAATKSSLKEAVAEGVGVPETPAAVPLTSTKTGAKAKTAGKGARSKAQIASAKVTDTGLTDTGVTAASAEIPQSAPETAPNKASAKASSSRKKTSASAPAQTDTPADTTRAPKMKAARKSQVAELSASETGSVPQAKASKSRSKGKGAAKAPTVAQADQAVVAQQDTATAEVIAPEITAPEVPVPEITVPERVAPSKTRSSKAKAPNTKTTKNAATPAKATKPRPASTAKTGRKPAPAVEQPDAELPLSEQATPEVPLSAPPAVPAVLPAEERAELNAGAAALNAAEMARPLAQPQPATAASDPQDSDTPSTAIADEKSTGSAAHQQQATAMVIAQLRKMGRPVHVRDFERSFTRQSREKLGHDVGKLLETLTHSGEVIRTRRNTYGLPEAMNLVRGRFQSSASGFGFVIPDSGGDDFYVREGETLEAWNGDIVLARPEGRVDNRYERRSKGGNNRSDHLARAAVVRIVTRAYSRLVGSLEYFMGYALLKPDDYRARHRIMLVQDGTEQLPAGARVVSQLFWPEETGEDEVYGEVVRVLGSEDDPATETQAVIVKYGLHSEFSEDVLQEAQTISTQLPPEVLEGRLDLRDYNIFTVDGSDAKDFDDAIHIQSTPEGNFVVGIHIADVSYYVRPGTALDEEAYNRATSVYLPGSVLPMLPEHLSNGVCSLVPYEDRLTMSAMITLSGDGDILSTAFGPSVIRSKARLTYDEVQAYSEASATLPEHARALEGDLHLLLKMTAKLRQKRLREGSLDFKMREVKVDIGQDGHMQLIPLHEETARGMIEDLMLLANKTVAHFLLEKNVPTLFRIHEEPTLGRFQETSAAIGRMGLAFPGGVPTPQAYQAVLKAVRGTPQESVVNTLLLRSMQQAKYAGDNLGHFGLAFEEYLHFTSPIRRYPDLLVHRALKLALQGAVSDRVRSDLAAPLAEQGRHTSERERNAAEAERDLTKYYQARWAEEHLDETFEGRVSGVIASGLFVALENGVEGRLHISNLDDDYYVYIEEASILKGRSNGRSYRIGDNIHVSISKVNPLARQIDFTQENSMDGNEKPRARRRDDRETQKREKLSTFLPSSSAPTTQAEADSDSQTPDQAAPKSSGHQRRENFSGARREGGRYSSQRPQGQAVSDQGTLPAQNGHRRRVVTLDRPRNEHLRPVNITVQRMYFGDWTMDNMPSEDSQGERSERGYRGGNNFRGRSNGNNQSRPSRDNRSTDSRSTERRENQPPREAQPRQDRAVSGDNGAVSDDARRRRRRRGRRGTGSSEGGSNGNGGSNQD